MNVEFKEYERLLKWWAHRIHHRIYSAGSQSTLFDDVYQEACVAWCIARDKWDQTSGVPFAAYLALGVRNHINRWADKEIIAHNWLHTDLDAPISGETKIDAHSVTPSETDSAFDILARNDVRDQNLACLSPDARKFVEILESPPPQLMAILDAQQAKRKFATSRGLTPGFCLRKLSSALIFDVMGADVKQRAAIMSEVRLIMNLEQMADA